MKLLKSHFNLKTLFLFIYSCIVTSHTIIDVLMNKPELSKMITLLQESRMIPLINRLNEITLLALKNSSLEDLDKKYPTRKDKENLVRYHLLEGKFTLESLLNRTKDNKPLIESFLYKVNGSQEWPLGYNKGQMVPLKGDKGTLAIGGVNLVEGDIIADNGIIHIVDDYLKPPPDALTIINNSPSLTHFQSFLNNTPDLLETLKQPKPVNLFLLEDNLVEQLLKDVEINYLLNEEQSISILDRYNFIGSYMVNETNPPVIYSQLINSTKPIYSLNIAGNPVVIKLIENKLNYNNVSIDSREILTSNGVIYILTKPHELLYDLKFDGMKCLIGLGANKFYNYAKNSKVKDYINSINTNQTVLVPSDNIFENNENKNTEELLFYHILSGSHTKSTLNQTGLVTTLLDSEGEGRVQQRIKVEQHNGEVILNGKANLIGKTYTINRTNLIKISALLDIPPNLFDYLNTEPDLSNFLQLLKASGLESDLKALKALTGLFPTNKAFSDDGQGLLMNYLIKNNTRSKKILNDFIKYSLVPHPVYSTAFTNISLTIPTFLNGTEVLVTNKDNKIIFSSKSNILPFDSTPKLYDSDQLIRSGVIQKIDSLLIPPSVYPNLTSYDFIKQNSGKTFLSLLKTANLTHLLTSSYNQSLASAVIVPTDEAFAKVNMTLLNSDIELLKNTLEFHFLSERVPIRLSHLKKTIAIPTISTLLPRLKVVFINHVLRGKQLSDTEIKNIKLRTEGAPAPLYQYDGTALMSGQAVDMSIVLVDQVLFLPPQNEGSSLLQILGNLVVGLASIGAAAGSGYLVYRRWLVGRFQGYIPIGN